MTDPVIFESESPRYALPLLFMGQAQKELFVNEALARLDALLHCAIEGEASDPPVAPENGLIWLVAAPATGAWAGHEGELACRHAGNWLFAAPRDGLRVLDLARQQEICFIGTWQVPSAPTTPSGGSTIDSEARSAIAELVTALRTAGILPAI
jgi:hypothetical protein